MSTLKNLILVVLFISFMVFVAFFGRLPALRRTPIAALHKLIWIHIPKAVLATDEALTGGRVSRYLTRFGTYLLHDRHWTVVIFFSLILFISQLLFLPEAWPKIGPLAKSTAVIAVILPYLFLYLACAADPGYISLENEGYHLRLYPYDHTLFHPGRACRTCKLIKPPRSKHCDICKRCVAKADHHCIFINSCVGYGNQHWFVLLLVSTAVLCTYGGLLGLSVVSARVRLYSPSWSVWKPRNMTTTEYIAGWGWGIEDNVNLGATTLLALLISPLVWGLLIYTLYLIYCGTTTNETLKWSEWKDDMSDGYAFRRSMSANRVKHEQFEPECTRWPVSVEQILVTTLDGQPPHDNQTLAGDGPWERVWNLSQVENLYDLGLWDNLMDIFIESYKFGGKAEEPSVERRQRER